MVAVTFLLGAVLISLGILGGYVTGKIAKEEVKHGLLYFDILQDIILALIIFLLLHVFRYHWIAIVAGAILIITIFKIKEVKYTYVIYALFAGIWFIGFASTIPLEFATLLLLYGVPTGTLLWYKKNKTSLAITPAIFLGVTLLLTIMFL